MKKLNTTAYHPQTDGLVERFNRTLTNMLAKRVERNGSDWDIQLPYVPFLYSGIDSRVPIFPCPRLRPKTSICARFGSTHQEI